MKQVYKPRVPPVIPHHPDQGGHVPRQAVSETGQGRENDRIIREFDMKLEGFTRKFSVDEVVVSRREGERR